jgi:hypothetical protein
LKRKETKTATNPEFGLIENSQSIDVDDFLESRNKGVDSRSDPAAKPKPR